MQCKQVYFVRMDNPAVIRQLASAMARAKGNKTLAKKHLLQAAAADHALLLTLAEPFLDSIAGYALDLYVRKYPDAASEVHALQAEAATAAAQKPAPQVSAKQKAAIELLAASYKKKS